MSDEAPFNQWFDALYERHTANLKFAEVRRALQALSTTYVERRDRLPRGAVFDGAGKRAAFALFYTPLHYLLVKHIVAELAPVARDVTDLGCGTGAGGAAWAGVVCDTQVVGLDVNAWALQEARWNYATLGLRGARLAQTNLSSVQLAGGPQRAALAAYTINELPEDTRTYMLQQCLNAARAGSAILIIEPISHRVTPWWQAWKDALTPLGGIEHAWKVALQLPEKLQLLDKAAGLNHRQLKARSLYVQR